MEINQGDLYWIDFGEPDGSGSGYRRPHVVVQNNLFNRSRINTVIVCGITSNVNRAQAPGTVSLERGEGNLPKESVVNASQIFTIDRGYLQEYIGTLSRGRVREILAGIDLVLSPRDVE